MISGKGFLFTVSVIFFASTLVFYTQQYVENNSFREEGIINSSKLASQPFLNDDIGFDLQRIFGFTLETEYSTDLNVSIAGVLPRGFDVSGKLGDYNSFLYGTFFGRIAGTKTIDLSGIADGKAELSIGSLLGCDFDYSNNDLIIYPKTGSVLSNVYLDIDANANDFNRYEWADFAAGSVPLEINYVDENVSFSVSESIDPDSLNKLAIAYRDDVNAYIVIGTNNAVDSSIKIDAESAHQLNYSLVASYLPSSDVNSLPVLFNATMRYSDSRLDSNSSIKIAG